VLTIYRSWQCMLARVHRPHLGYSTVYCRLWTCFAMQSRTDSVRPQEIIHRDSVLTL